MRILIIGASGFIGRYLSRRLGAMPGHEVFCTFRSRPPGDDRNHWYQVELTDPVRVEKLFGAIHPEMVVHLAALADVGTAEREPERARAVNVAATAEIVRQCDWYGARLLFVSTEYVFDGRRGLYREDDPPHPTTQYGRTKLAAELEVARLGSRASVLRTSIVYGWPEPGSRNFVPWLIDRLQGGETYAGAAQVMRSPIYVEQLVEGIVGLVMRDHSGVNHVAGGDWVSMYEFARAIAAAFGLDQNLVVPKDDQTANPDRLGLDSTRTLKKVGLERLELADGLAAMRESPNNPFAG
ncbi:MAG: SDR family oxidoreductase [Chloroflexi bacterium]|nr:SDR family oxidoreductase [Chloroflexota bacterium]